MPITPIPKRRPTVIRFDITDVKSMAHSRDYIRKVKRRLRSDVRPLMVKMQTEIQLRYAAAVLRDLQRYPSLSQKKHPLRWKSEKQRRYVMMLLTQQAKARGIKNPKGKDLEYKRTGRLKRGWRVYVKSSLSGANGAWLSVTVDHESRGMSNVYMYVHGILGTGRSKASLKKYAKTQQPFHQDTGWRLVTDILAPYKRGILDYVQRTAMQWADDVLADK